MTTPDSVTGDRSAPEVLRQVETALKRFGYSRVPVASREASIQPEFWVQEAGVPRRTFPVFVESASLQRLAAWVHAMQGPKSTSPRAIVVVPTDHAADEAWSQIKQSSPSTLDPELSILVLPTPKDLTEPPHWHTVVVTPKELLRLATGVVVGLFRRAHVGDAAAQVDFEEMLQILRDRFRVDLYRSLNVASDEDALFMLYQLAVRDTYAPGDPGANLHVLVLRPTGPAARLPWFAA
jgi:hypothetical protein